MPRLREQRVQDAGVAEPSTLTPAALIEPGLRGHHVHLHLQMQLTKLLGADMR